MRTEKLAVCPSILSAYSARFRVHRYGRGIEPGRDFRREMEECVATGGPWLAMI